MYSVYFTAYTTLHESFYANAIKCLRMARCGLVQRVGVLVYLGVFLLGCTPRITSAGGKICGRSIVKLFQMFHI